MKTLEIGTTSRQVSDLIDAANKQGIVLTDHGRPVAMLLSVSRHPLEMEPPEEFWRMIEERRKRPRSELLDWEDVKAELLPPTPTRKPRKRQSRQK